MILKAKHHPVIYPFFRIYAGLIVRKHFRKISIVGNFPDKNLPVLLIANHFSWWDGFWAAYVNFSVFRKKFCFMMKEEQLRNYWFFNYAGGFSIRERSKSILETIRYTNELLTDHKNIVLLFPQGEIESMHCRQIVFKKGIEKILSNQNNPIQIVFLVNLVDYFSSKKPNLYMYLRDVTDSPGKLDDLQNNFNSFYQECLNAQRTLKG